MREITVEPCRRDFLRVGVVAGMGLLVECHLPNQTHAADALGKTESGIGAFEPNAWLRIGTDDTVTVMVNHSEMGQGITTALSMVIAEELEVDWGTIRPEIAPRSLFTGIPHSVYRPPEGARAFKPAGIS